MNKHPHGANGETLLLFSWLCTQDLTTQWRNDQQARPWKYPVRAQPWQEQHLTVFPEELIHQHVTDALQGLHADPLYGPAFEALVRYRLVFVDIDRIAWSIELHEQTAAMCALYYATDPYYSQPGDYAGRHQTTELADEVDAFWQAASSHEPLVQRWKWLRETCGGDVCLAARYLQAFFLWYADHARRKLQAPFFVWELLTISLKKMDWHALASRILNTISTEPCICSPLQAGDFLGKPVVALPDFAIRAITILSNEFSS